MIDLFMNCQSCNAAFEPHLLIDGLCVACLVAKTPELRSVLFSLDLLPEHTELHRLNALRLRAIARLTAERDAALAANAQLRQAVFDCQACLQHVVWRSKVANVSQADAAELMAREPVCKDFNVVLESCHAPSPPTRAWKE
jgi:hypothetical protein